MSKLLKFILCLFLIMVMFININTILATEDNINEEEIVEENENIEDETNVITEDASDISSLSVLKPSTGTNVSNINSYEQANLSLNNILCILLAAIGVILILLAIAILIRLGGK